MRIKKGFGFLHRWLGLVTGAVVLVVCLTGALWCFSPDIEGFQPFRHVGVQPRPFLPADTLIALAERHTGKASDGLRLDGPASAAVVDLPGESADSSVFLNPYTGAVLHVQNDDRTFFAWVLNGHKRLWIPKVGGTIVAWSTLVFLFMIVSGMVLWWPKNKAAARQRFRFRWKPDTRWKRKNYDLHSVLGFYAGWLLLATVLTGVVWSFDWASDLEYTIANGGVAREEFPGLVSVRPTQPVARTLDSALSEVAGNYPRRPALRVSLPAHDSDVYTITARTGTLSYDEDYYYYDRYRFLPIGVPVYGRYRDALPGERLSRMNYDIHTGMLLGYPARIALFFAALTGASLPVTGFLIWRGRRR